VSDIEGSSGPIEPIRRYSQLLRRANETTGPGQMCCQGDETVPGTEPSARRPCLGRANYALGVVFSTEKYMLFTSYRRDGTAVATPVWLVEINANTLGFYTSSGSGKAKRLAHTPRVTVQPCNARGVPKPGTLPQAATANVVEGAEYEQIHARVVAKYGVMTKFTEFLGTVGGILKRKRIPYGDRAVVVTLAP
jgi:PPOX class probable F420-dependent enzyme